MKIFAYFEEWSRRPGESVRMAISTPLTEVTAELVRLTTGPGAAGQSHVGTEPVSEVPATRASGRLQDSPVGSYAQLPLENLDPREGVTVHCFIWPTLPAKGVQTIWALNHASGRVELVLSGGRLQLLADGVLASSTHWAAVLGGVALWGMHMGITQGLLATLVAATAPEDLRGTAFGVYNLLGGLARFVASAGAGLLWSRWGAAAAFGLSAGFGMLALLLLARQPSSTAPGSRL